MTFLLSSFWSCTVNSPINTAISLFHKDSKTGFFVSLIGYKNNHLMLIKSNINENYSYYRSCHQVMLQLKPVFNTSMSDLPATSFDKHAEYYRKEEGKLVSYGYCMNQYAICIVLNVDCSDDLERIISNDPQLISGALEVDVIIPFRSLI